MEYFSLVRERYSVRKFSDQPVEPGKITTLLEAARWAPTAVNKQPYRLLVLAEPAAMEKLKGCTPYTFNAPAAVIVFSCAGEAWVRPYDQYNAAVIDAAIVGTHIMLAAHAIGLGSTWVGHFDPAALREIYSVPAELEPIAVFPVGYPAADAEPAAFHDKRKRLDETVFYETFQ